MGCSADFKSTKKDPFFEKWNTLADNSQGHSPEAKPKKIDIDRLAGKKMQTSRGYGRDGQKTANQTD